MNITMLFYRDSDHLWALKSEEIKSRNFVLTNSLFIICSLFGAKMRTHFISSEDKCLLFFLQEII